MLISPWVNVSFYQQNMSWKYAYHILDDDALLNIFYLYRPDLTDEEEYSENTVRVLQGGRWSREGWWHRLAQVFRRWRYLILASPSYLGLRLVCTYGTPIAKMLAHSPPLPLIIDYINEHRRITAKDANGILLALNHRDRVHRIRLLAPVRRLKALVTSMEGHFPQLEFLYIAPLSKHRTSLILPRTFRASHLRHLVLINFAFPMQSPFPTTTTSLVALSLQMIHPSAYFPPSDLLPQLSLMPQLETLGIGFNSPLPNHDVERQLLDNPSMMYVTLPNLRWFGFEGVSAYCGALLSRISTPLLERLQIILRDQLTTTIAVSQLLQFMGKTRRLRFRGLKFNFGFREFIVTAYPDGASDVCSFYMFVTCTHLDRQVATTAQIFNVLGPVFSEVECLTLKYRTATRSSQGNVMVDGARWRELLQPFSHVKTLVVPDGLVRELSHSLLLDDGELPLDLLPELTELVYSARGHAEYPFSPFINARQIAGLPVRLVDGDLLP